MNLFIKYFYGKNHIIMSDEVTREKVDEFKNNQYSKLLKLLEENVDMDKLSDIMNGIS